MLNKENVKKNLKGTISGPNRAQSKTTQTSRAQPQNTFQ